MNELILSLLQYAHAVSLPKILELDNDIQIRFLAQGEYNKNFVLTDKNTQHPQFVLRVNYGSQITVPNQIEYEHNTLRTLEQSQVTPRVYFVDGSYVHFPNGILVMEYLDGKALEYEKDLAAAAHIFRQIHNVPMGKENPQGHIVEAHILSDRIKEADILLKDVWQSEHLDTHIKKSLQQIVDYAHANAHKEKYYLDDAIFCINNTEVNSRNFIIGETQSYLVDWEKAVVTDPCQDITHFLAPTTTLWKTECILTPAQKEFFFSAYEKNNSLLKHHDIRERVALYYPYLIMRAMSWCAYAYVEYQKPDKAISNQETYKKIQQYLSIDFIKEVFTNVL